MKILFFFEKRGSPWRCPRRGAKLDLVILVLADDLTGALEAGSRLASAGIAARVVTKPPTAQDLPALVIDTESRHLAPAQAAERVRTLANFQSNPRLVYKKTDSTLRGNIGAELGALLRLWPGRKLHYAPAYPRMGRTVANGMLLVDGVPVHLTSFAQDPLDPVTESRIAVVLARQCRAASESIHILDAATDADLAEAARVVLTDEPPVLVAGAAAFLGCLAALLSPRRPAVPAWPRLERCLVLNGSLHEASAHQVSCAEAHGVFSSGWRLFGTIEALPAAGTERDLLLGRIVMKELDTAEALIIFGGDTAFGILCALHEPPIEPLGEILPGVPISRLHADGRDLVLVTKAGGFGSPDLLVRLHGMLSG